MKIGIVVSLFNSSITDRLLIGAKTGLKEEKAEFDVVEVPGAFEIPLAAAKLAELQKYDALITLGVVVKGKTDHYDMICRACTDGIRQVMLEYKIPIAFEVLMVHNIKFARERADKRKDLNAGYYAAKVAVQMAHLMES